MSSLIEETLSVDRCKAQPGSWRRFYMVTKQPIPGLFWGQLLYHGHENTPGIRLLCSRPSYRYVCKRLSQGSHPLVTGQHTGTVPKV